MRTAVISRVNRRIQTEGEISFPAAPTLLGVYLERLTRMFASMGKELSQDELAHLESVLAPRLEEGFRDSAHARVHVKWASEPSPGVGIDYRIWLVTGTLAAQYEQWASSKEKALFGRNADAKVLSVARALGKPANHRVLDLGAGTGRNALPLARAGHPTDALELTEGFCTELEELAQSENLPVAVIRGNALDPDVCVEGDYSLVVCSEVASHFRSSLELRTLFERAVHWLRTDGLLLVSVFVPVDGYEPDQLAREVAQIAWSTVFTRAELDDAKRELPLSLLSDEPVYGYEKEHQPAAGWPPTAWFEDWSRGFNGYGVESGLPPMELRWLVYRKLAEGQ